MKTAVWEMGAFQSLDEDLGATLILIAAASVDRLYRTVGVSLFNRGVSSYGDGISFVRAIQSLANQYKHLGEWLNDGARSEVDFNNCEKACRQSVANGRSVRILEAKRVYPVR